MAAPLVFPSLKVGDTFGLLQYQLLLDGVPLPIDAATDVIFRMVTRATPPVVIIDDASGVVVDAALGIVGYQRSDADVANALQVKCEFTLTFPSTEVHVSPNINLDIVADLP